MIEIVPSILSADFARLAEEVALAERGGARMLHVDVMDGHFVPNLTLGPPVIASLRKATSLHLDVHLMIEDPELSVESYLRAGANSVSVHVEACRHLDATLNVIRSAGAKAGVVLNPATPLSAIEECLQVADYVLFMSVNPGFGGQKLIPYVLEKVRRLVKIKQERHLTLPIEIDGGVNRATLAEVVRAGCDWIVTGSAVFHSGDAAAEVRALGEIANDAARSRV